jgi:transcriptional repressor NrdR
MRCPFCKKDHDRVIDSRSANGGATVRRRRKCLSCQKRFTTYEKVEEITLYVIKKDGRRDVFDREKIKRGLLTACKKRPVSLQTIEDIVNRIEIELYENYDREVKSTKIGDLVMRELKTLDHVAYVRFASVYREFKDVSEFMRELKPMLAGPPAPRRTTGEARR